jgi:hypothetical protein
MPTKPIPPQETLSNLNFPLGGIDLSRAYSKQQPRSTPTGERAGTTPIGTNVRAFDVLQQRERGGSRPGLTKYVPLQPGGTSLIQELNGFTAIKVNAPVPPGAQTVVQTQTNLTSKSCTFSNPVTSGNGILVLISCGGGAAPTTLTDNAATPNVYSQASSGVLMGDVTMSVFYSIGVLGAASLELSYTDAQAGNWTILEIETIVAAGLDQEQGASGSSGSPSLPTMTPGQNNEICVEGIFTDSGPAAPTTPTGFTSLISLGGSFPCQMGYQLLPATTPLNLSWTIAGTRWAAAAATFKSGVVAASPQITQSGRITILVAVVQGVVYATTPGSGVWVTPANNTGNTLNTTGVVRSAVNNQKVWFADGTHYLYYDPTLSEVLNWTASQGSLPSDTGGNKPRLICTWRGRTVLSGLLLDAQNWFMSAVGDPTNFNYFPYPITPTQAIAGNNSALGLIGDPVTCLIPYTDDTLIFGCDGSIWVTQGDPMAGGSINLVSSTIGMAWGNPWCKGPDGTLYFLSNKMGVYQWMPGQNAPTRISQAIDQLLIPINSGTCIIRMLWADIWQGFHLFITQAASAQPATHFFWESRTGAWWQDQFANNNMNPLCCCTFDGNTSTDRYELIGSWDGYVRSITPTATSDDGTNIGSSVILGPLLTDNLDDVLWKSIQAVLGVGTGTVSYNVLLGSTAEIALANGPVASGTWTAGRNKTNLIRFAGHALWLQLTSSSPWAYETTRVVIAGRGKVRQRY